MIERINLRGFGKLPDIDQPLDRLNVITGPNGTGKSARSIGLQLAVLGYVPGGPKRNADILSAYAGGDKLFVGITVNKTSFTRRFARKEDGTVGQDYLLDRRKASAKDYIQAMAGVRVLDLRAFLVLSDQKQTDHIFALYPPGGDLADLDEKIEALKTRQNSTVARIKALEMTVERLKTGRAEIQLPAGTLAEVVAEIATTETLLKQAQEQHTKAQVEAAQRVAALKATQEAEAKAAQALPGIEAAAKAKAESAVYVQQQEQAQAVQEAGCLSMGDMFASAVRIDASASIRTVLETMQRVGCTSCAAVLVAKRELRKYQERSVA